MIIFLCCISTYILVLVNKLLNSFVYIMIIFLKRWFFLSSSCLLLFVYYSFVCILDFFLVSLLKSGAIINAQIDKEIINSNTHADISTLSISCILCLLVSIVCLFFLCIYKTKPHSFRDVIKIFKRKRLVQISLFFFVLKSFQMIRIAFNCQHKKKKN